jgi:hypothetical protein
VAVAIPSRRSQGRPNALDIPFVNAVDERPRCFAGKLGRLKVVEVPANLEASWKGATCELEHAYAMSREQSRAHRIAEPLVGAEDDPSTRTGLGDPHAIIEPFFGRTVYRPQRVDDETAGAESVGKLVSP